MKLNFLVFTRQWHQMFPVIPTELHKHHFGFLGEYRESLLLKASLLQLAAIYSSSYMMVQKKERTLTKRKNKTFTTFMSVNFKAS